MLTRNETAGKLLVVAERLIFVKFFGFVEHVYNQVDATIRQQFIRFMNCGISFKKDNVFDVIGKRVGWNMHFKYQATNVTKK